MKLTQFCTSCVGKTTARVPTAVMAFFACFVSYSVRLSLNLAILAMVEPTGGSKAGSECLPEKPSNTGGAPAAPDGVVFPALHALVAQWAPPNEKGKFIFSLMGGTFSTVVTWPAVGALIEALGWPSAYYYVTLTCCAWGVAWLLLVYDSPALHPFITDAERSYIIEAQAGTVQTTQGIKRRRLPLRGLLTSVPFYALVAMHFGNLWGLFLLTTDTPVFLSEVLGFSISKSGFLGSLPSLGRCIMSLVFGVLVDYIVKKELWKNKNSLRKTFVIFSHILPGALMLGLGFVGCSVEAAVSLLTIGLSLNGASTVTNLVNHHDLAPNYAGTLYGFMNGVGTTTLWIVPSVTGAVLEINNGLKEWRIIYSIGAGIYLISGIVFILFGSANIQKWNYIDEEDQPDETNQPAQEAADKPAEQEPKT